MRYAVTIDIGGTTTTYAVVDENGVILQKDTILTRGFADFEQYCKILFEGIHKMLGCINREELAGIGIGAPCANHETGEIEAATDLPWPSPIPLKSMFEKEFGYPVSVANDAKAAAIGEMTFGAAKGMKNFILITLGTGVGSGIVCDGRLLSGRSGFAGELGHITVLEGQGRPCGCGRKDCLQNYCSSSGIKETAKRLLKETGQPSTLRELPDGALDPKQIFDHAKRGDSLSLGVFRETGRVLGKACASFAAFTAPEAIIFFGGVANAFQLMEPGIRESMEENILFLHKGKIKLLKSELDEADAALLGASALVFQK